MVHRRYDGSFLPYGLKAERLEMNAREIRVIATPRQAKADCPGCGKDSRRIHSRYQRTLIDLPAHGRQVRIVLTARRFRCTTPEYQTSIFTERFAADVARPFARRTTRLQCLVRHLGLALGDRPAQSLAKRLVLPVSKDTCQSALKATKILPVRVIDPPLDDLLVGQIVDVLEVVQADHQARRLGRAAQRFVMPAERLVER